eukprot:XP_015578831.1 uncharacterized protein LOC107261767 [Ricinus communis]
MCADYSDLNKACPKDDFPFHHIDVIVDNTALNVIYSFIDGFSEYNQIMIAVVDKLKMSFITEYGTFATRPQVNGAVEATNKNLKKILSKMVWDHMDYLFRLPFALWGYQTTELTSIGQMPYSMVYGTEAILPVELELKSLRVILEVEILEY